MSSDQKWDKTTIGKSSYLRGRIGWQGLRASEFKADGPFLVTGTDFKGGKINWDTCYHVSEERYAEAEYIHVRDNDVLITKDGTIGKIALVKDCPSKTVLNSGIFLLRCKDGTYQHPYIYHVLQSYVFRKFLDDNLAGSTIQHLYQYVFENFKFDIPSQPEQSKIAEVLSTVDRAIEQTEGLIAKQQRIKTGLMQDLLTRGIDEHGNIRSEETHEFKDSPLGRIPREWEVKRLGCVFDTQLGKMLNPKAKNGNNPAYYLGNKNVQWEHIDSTVMEWMDFSERERKKFGLIKGDILVCEGGEVGRSCVWQDQVEDCFYQKAIHRLRAKGNYIPELFPKFMQWAIRCSILADYTSQTSIAHLTKEKLEAVWIPVPEYNEQVRMQNIFNAYDLSKQITATQLDKLRSLKSALMQDLLTGKVRVTPLLEEMEATD